MNTKTPGECPALNQRADVFCLEAIAEAATHGDRVEAYRAG